MPELRKTELVRRPLSWNDLCHRFKNLVKQSSKSYLYVSKNAFKPSQFKPLLLRILKGECRGLLV